MIEIRGATKQERGWGCNMCESLPEPAEVVMLIGRERTSTAVRMCTDDFLALAGEVDIVSSWDKFRDYR